MLGKFRNVLLAACAGVLSSGVAMADPIRVNFLPTNDGLSLYVAQEQGFFSERGLEVVLSAAPNPGVVISSLAAGSSDIGHTVLIPVIAAAQAGIDLKVIAGATAFPIADPPAQGIIAHPDSGIHSPGDLEGKTVGVVGLESFLQIMVQRWMEENGADSSNVRFVEVPFPQMQGLLDSNNVDAVVSVDPFYSKTIAESSGYVFGNFSETVPDGVKIAIYVSSGQWAEDNPDEAIAFRDALAEADAFILDSANEDEVRRNFAHWTNLPEPVVATARWGAYDAVVTEGDIQYWMDVMDGLGLLEGNIEAADLVPSVFK